MPRIRQPERYTWFEVRRWPTDMNTPGEFESWFAFSVRVANYVNWCETNIGSRYNHEWVIMQNGKDEYLIPSRAYNLQTIHKIGIAPTDMAMLFRLKFGI